jgi:predicted alpha-1,2-mannosidase
MIRGACMLGALVLFGAACDREQGDDDTGGQPDDDLGDDDATEPPLDDFCPGDLDLAAFVDPMIGTDGSGNSLPGALVPHGMVRVSPDTLNDGGAVDAYEYDNSHIEGFTHTHWQGPGGGSNGYSQILLQPFSGPLRAEVGDYASAFSHDTEQASPGYYRVTLADDDVDVELTATALAGVHRYRFPAGGDPAVLLDLGHSLGDSRDGRVVFVDDSAVQGFGHYNVHPLMDLVFNQDGGTTGERTVYFHARFSEPFATHGSWQRDGAEIDYAEGADDGSGAWLGAYATFTGVDEVEVRIGLSNISAEQARLNLEAQVADATFEQVHEAARSAWNCRLNRLEVEGGTDDDRINLYTALYHTLMQPADHTEVGGAFWSAADETGAVFDGAGHRFYTDDWCAWDTFRTSRPLATLIEPATVNDVVASYLHLYEQGGWLPKCTWQAGGYSRVMIGNHGVPIVADALDKGFDGFDLQLAWDALYRSAFEDNAEEFSEGLCGYANLGTPPEYIALGYVPHECDTSQSVSMTLEYAYDDWCIGRVAAKLGHEEFEDDFTTRGGYYVNHWDEQLAFMRGRNRDGSWTEPFDPTDDSDFNDFCEADSWIYTWFVPHDVPGLIALFGGEEAFIERLDAFFADGHFEVSNEPSFHVPYLYNYAGAPERTQEIVRETLRNDFAADAGGLPGNDDAGATSAWYAFAAVGLYPVAPGDGQYQLSTPLFSRITLHLDPLVYDGGTFVVEADGVGDEQPYLLSASLDGVPIDGTALTHAQITAGGTLTLEVGPEPSSRPVADPIR